MAGTKRGLGRGLGALFGEDTIEEVIAEEKAADRKKANGADRIVEKNSARTQKNNIDRIYLADSFVWFDKTNILCYCLRCRSQLRLRMQSG